MPVGVARRGKKWRVVEHGGRIVTNAAGTPVDGPGHDTREGALAQARAINANLHKKAFQPVLLNYHKALSHLLQ